MGAPADDYEGAGGGAVYLVFGPVETGEHALEEIAHTKFITVLNNMGVGKTLAGRGDIDGDDIPDIVIGAPVGIVGEASPTEGNVFVVYGCDI